SLPFPKLGRSSATHRSLHSNVVGSRTQIGKAGESPNVNRRTADNVCAYFFSEAWVSGWVARCHDCLCGRPLHLSEGVAYTSLTMDLLVCLLFGLSIGSFLNVCIARLPQYQSVVHPRSRCPKCEKLIAWYDNIPVFSYLILGGHCRSCKSKISARYPAVELLTGVLSV